MFGGSTDKSIIFEVVDPVLSGPINQVPAWSSPSNKSNKSKVAEPSPSQNSGELFTVPDSGAGSTVIDTVSISLHVPLSIVYVNSVVPIGSTVMSRFVGSVTVSPLASVHVPLLLSWDPSKVSNKLKGEFAAKSFSQNVALTAKPAFGSGKTITWTVVDSSGQGLGNRFWVYV